MLFRSPFEDQDQDGVAACEDCDDTNAAAHPGATEVCDEVGTDEDCNGLSDDADPGVDPSSYPPTYTDMDGDGYGTGADLGACDAQGATRAGDCDDASYIVHPGASENCQDTIDYNCDGSVGSVDQIGRAHV